jgi:chromosome partitioning protein
MVTVVPPGVNLAGGRSFSLVRLGTSWTIVGPGASGTPIGWGWFPEDKRGSVNIVVSNVKGGVGKTTTTIYLAAAAVARGWDPVLVVDADRQASSAEWLEESPIEGIQLVEAPSERTVNRAMSGTDGLVVVDTPPGDERIVRAALGRADAVVIPTRAGGVEYSRVAATLDMIEGRTPYGVVISAARLGTRDLDEAVRWWTDSKVPIWGIVPERVGIAAGPEAKLYREGLDEYDAVLKKAVRRRSN